MLPILALATLALTTPAPITVNFTSDSVYTNESIISPKEIIDQEDGKYTIVLEENKLLGYCVYDNSETEYLDGLKFDDTFVTNYIIKDVDLGIEHTILVKTVYTDDIAGMLAAAKDGDWTVALSNPLILFQMFYYILAAISLVLSGFGILKSRKKKVLDHNQIAESVKASALASKTEIQAEVKKVMEEIINPTISTVKGQVQNVIKAFILSQSGGKDARLALIDMLKNSSEETVDIISDNAIKAVNEAAELKEKAKAEADKAVKEIAEGIFNNSDTDVRF